MKKVKNDTGKTRITGCSICVQQTEHNRLLQILRRKTEDEIPLDDREYMDIEEIRRSFESDREEQSFLYIQPSVTSGDCCMAEQPATITETKECNMQKLTDDIEKILFSEQQLAECVRQLGSEITKDYADEDLLMIGILKGAGIFMGDLIRQIDGDVRTDYMVVSSYGNSSVSSGQIRIIKDVQVDVKGLNVMLVEDIADTGNTLNALKDIMIERGVRSVRICALLDKPARRIKPIDIDYKGFEVPDEFIIGYGIDYAEKYRNLPYIGILKKEVYE